MTIGRIPSVEGGIQPTIVDAKGDLIAGVAADTVNRLAVGANGTVLTADSAEATGLKWAAPASGGKILQVVSAQTTTEKVISSGSLTDTNLTATITPTSASSTILIMVSQPYVGSYTSGTYDGAITLLRGASQVWNTLTRNNLRNIGPSTMTELRDLAAFFYVDSPATTSATTYKTQALAGSSSMLIFQNTSHPSNIVLMEIGA